MKRIKRIISTKIAPILVIVFALAMLIGGGAYLYAAVVGTVTSGQPLTSALWNNMANRVNTMRLDCTTVAQPMVVVSGGYWGSTASCAASYSATGGACECGYDPDAMYGTYVTANSYTCICGHPDNPVTYYTRVVCCRVIAD